MSLRYVGQSTPAQIRRMWTDVIQNRPQTAWIWPNCGRVQSNSSQYSPESDQSRPTSESYSARFVWNRSQLAHVGRIRPNLVRCRPDLAKFVASSLPGTPVLRVSVSAMVQWQHMAEPEMTSLLHICRVVQFLVEDPFLLHTADYPISGAFLSEGGPPAALGPP